MYTSAVMLYAHAPASAADLLHQGSGIGVRLSNPVQVSALVAVARRRLILDVGSKQRHERLDDLAGRSHTPCRGY